MIGRYSSKSSLRKGLPMTIDIWIAALRVLIVLMTISIVWPSLLEPWRWVRTRDTKRATK